MTKGQLYPLADWTTLDERRALVGEYAPMMSGRYRDTYRTEDGRLYRIQAQYTGEKRPPRAGEWYLSGAIVEAYNTSCDLPDAYHIAKLVLTKTVSVTVTASSIED